MSVAVIPIRSIVRIWSVRVIGVRCVCVRIKVRRGGIFTPRPRIAGRGDQEQHNHAQQKSFFHGMSPFRLMSKFFCAPLSSSTSPDLKGADKSLDLRLRESRSTLRKDKNTFTFMAA